MVPSGSCEPVASNNTACPTVAVVEETARTADGGVSLHAALPASEYVLPAAGTKRHEYEVGSSVSCKTPNDVLSRASS